VRVRHGAAASIARLGHVAVAKSVRRRIRLYAAALKVTTPVDAGAAPMSQFPQAADGFHPPEDLFDSVSVSVG